ncbi:hypothetical protein Bca52824_095378 [Brassica carinata]|uniref:F-box domain-containing protein n=1 Tax=Brassica carinata TaxID=52824 RepID=A0A8X7P2N4_BRACI|nr:hypothetical protein Bca52824_095378 [Brassica carinata]
MENNYISFFFNAICGLLGYCLARHAILRTDNGTRRIFAWRWETKRRKKDDLLLDDENKISLLDLPYLTLDCILEKLSASELCLMTCVCSELREKCVSDHLWEKHMEKKWGRLMGAAATLEWKSHVSAMSTERPSCGGKRRRSSSSSSIGSVMYWYSNLESGKFWFPAQVRNVVSPFTKYASLMNPLARSIEELLPERMSESIWCFLLLRTALVASSVCSAFLIPFLVRTFCLVMALIGSLLSILVAIVMPALCFIRIMGNKATRTQMILSSIIVVIGLVSGTLGTYSSVAKIIRNY